MLLGVSMVSGGGGCYYVARCQYGIRGWGCYYVARSQYGTRGWGVLLCC